MCNYHFCPDCRCSLNNVGHWVSGFCISIVASKKKVIAGSYFSWGCQTACQELALNGIMQSVLNQWQKMQIYYNTEPDKRPPWRHAHKLNVCGREREDDSRYNSARVESSETLWKAQTHWGQEVVKTGRKREKGEEISITGSNVFLHMYT